MDVSFVSEFISPVALAVCLCVGYVIKNWIPDASVNKLIPTIAAILGVVIVCWATMSVTPESVVSGLVSGLASTGLYEAFSQLIGKRAE